MIPEAGSSQVAKFPDLEQAERLQLFDTVSICPYFIIDFRITISVK